MTGALDVAVAGCGPAGLAAALMLARDGHRVALFDRFSKPEPVGSGLLLQPTGLAVLHTLDLASAACRRGARVDRISGMAGKRIVLDVRYSALQHDGACAIGIHRSALFDILTSSVVGQGIPIHPERTVTGSRLAGGKRWLSFADADDDGPFDLVVDALGTRSPLAPPTGRNLAYGALWANIDWVGGCVAPNALSQRYRRADTMAGALPIGQAFGSDRAQLAFFWSLRARDYQKWRACGLDKWKADVVGLWPAAVDLVGQINSTDDLTFAQYAHRTLKQPVEERLIHIGDAWHSASPQLGQGANMAFLDAFALAKALRETSDLAAGLDKAAALRLGHVRTYQLLTALLTPVYQSDSKLIPVIRDHLVGPVSKIWPIPWLQAALVSGLVGNPLKRLGIDFAHDGGRR